MSARENAQTLLSTHNRTAGELAQALRDLLDESEREWRRQPQVLEMFGALALIMMDEEIGAAARKLVDDRFKPEPPSYDEDSDFREGLIQAVIRATPMHISGEGLRIDVTDLEGLLRRCYNSGRAIGKAAS